VARLKSEGATFADVTDRAARVIDLQAEIVCEKCRRPQVVHARSLLFYWAVKKLGMSKTEIANRLGLTQPAVSIVSKWGVKIVKQNGYSHFDK
jgi:hypothetical protein